MRGTRERFVMVIADHDRKEFSVEGPMSDDTDLTEAVVRAQEVGRRINCSTAKVGVAQAAEDYARTYGYTQVAAGSIVELDLP